MKVKCIETKRLNKEGSYQSLKVGYEYIVLAIEFYDKSTFSESIGDFTLYRIKDNDGVVKPFPAKLFKITSGDLPTCWVVYEEKDGSYSILPKIWAREGFWEDYYNDVYDALKDFKEVEKKYI